MSTFGQSILRSVSLKPVVVRVGKRTSGILDITLLFLSLIYEIATPVPRTCLL
jgi:hypothetical protein